MPSFLVEYTTNVAPEVDPTGLVEVVHEAAFATGLFARTGMRTRAVPVSDFRVSDGNPANGFVQVSARIKAGRTVEDRQRLGETILRAVEAYLGPVFARRPFAVYVEVAEIGPVSVNVRTNA